MSQIMMKKVLLPGAIICGLATASYGLTDTGWRGGTNDWETGTWSGGATPLTVDQNLKVNIDGGSAANVTLSSAATVGLLAMGYSNTSPDTMNQLTLANGAYLTTGIESDNHKNWTAIGYMRASTLTVQTGATLDCRSYLILGRSGSAATDIANPSYLNIFGGTVAANGHMHLGNDNASRCSGGGVITIDDGGSLSVKSFIIWNHVTIFQSYIQMNNGTLILNDDVDIQAMIDAGTLKGDNLTWDYDITNSGKTTVTAQPETANGTPITWLNGFDLATDETDPDADGYLTWQEYILNTDPTNTTSRLDLSISSNALAFSIETNRLYGVETCDDLSSDIWNVVTNNLPGSGNPIIFQLNPTNTAAFYRVNVRLP